MLTFFFITFLISAGRGGEIGCNSGALCIPISECQEMIEIVQDDKLLKFARSLFCGYFHEPYVCCNRDCETPNGSYGKSTILENCYKLNLSANSPDGRKAKFLRDSHINSTHVCCNIDENDFKTVPTAPIENYSTSKPYLQSLNLSCVTPNGLKGVCKYVNECEAYRKVIKQTDRELKFVNDSFCGWWKEPMICCSEDFQYNERYENKLPSLDRCGEWKNLDELPPWLVLIESDGEFCVGALINEEYVLATTKCAPNSNSSLKVGLCIYDETRTECRFTIKEYKVFPRHRYVYSEDSGIVLLKLNGSAYGYGLLPICLPQTELAEYEMLEIVNLRKSVYETWEKLSVTFEAISNDICHDGLRAYLKNIICIKNAEMCQLKEFRLQNLVVRKEDERWFLEGLFQEQECHKEYFRAVYVYTFLKWIKSNLE